MVKQFFALVIACSVLAISPLYVHAQEQSKEVNGVRAAMYETTFNLDANGRKKLAKALAVYCTGMLSILPTNSPDEQAWVDAEADTTDTAKILRLVNTPEWARFQLKAIFAQCASTSVFLARALDTQNKKGEAGYWINLAYVFNADTDAINYAKRTSLDSRRHGFDLLSSFRSSMLNAAGRAVSEIK